MIIIMYMQQIVIMPHTIVMCFLCFCVVQKQRLLFACMVWFTFMYFFWKLGDPFPILSPKHGIILLSVIFSYLGINLTHMYEFLLHNMRVLYV